MDGTFLIGLTGRAGSGKDTAATFIGYETYAFAKPLKVALAAMGFPEPVRALKEKPIAGFKFTWRKAAQTLGTEWGRSLQSDLWLQMAKVYRKQTRTRFLVITDVRFHNEADWIREFGILVHVRGRSYEMNAGEAQHASEIELPTAGPDFIIDNSKDLLHMRNQVHDLLHLIADR